MAADIKAIAAVFQAAGFEGATLSQLSEASGLKRASLYHHYPDGKSGMADAVLTRAGAALARDVIAPLRSNAAPADRLRDMIAGVRHFYGPGPASCLLETLSLGTGRELFADGLKAGATAWISALAATLADGGLDDEAAQAAAEDFLAGVEGALVLSRVFGENRLAPYLDRAERRLLGAVGQADQDGGTAGPGL